MATSFPRRGRDLLHGSTARSPQQPNGEPRAHKMSQPSQVQGEAVVTPVQTRPGPTAAWMCRDALVPGRHQRRAETDGRSPQQGGQGWAAVGTGQGWCLQPEPKEPQVLAGGTGTLGLRAGVSSLLQTSWLGQISPSQLFSKEVFLISQLKSPVWSLWP